MPGLTAIVYQLPFGTGQHFLDRPGIMHAFFGGWELNGIATARTGLPVNVTIHRANRAVPYGYSVPSSKRPDYVYGASVFLTDGQTPNNWINPAAFVAPLSGTFGNLGRNALRGPGPWQLDLALGKNISFTEKLGLQLRAEAFNVFNRAQHGNPNADLSPAGNFGTITTTVNSGATGSCTPGKFNWRRAFRFETPPGYFFVPESLLELLFDCFALASFGKFAAK